MSTCCAQVWYGRSFFSCSKGAKYEHGGKPYCGTHYPPNVEARRQKSVDKWKAERDASAEKARQFRIESVVKDWCADWVRENRIDVYRDIKRRAEEQPR